MYTYMYCSVVVNKYSVHGHAAAIAIRPQGHCEAYQILWNE
jgi:hypothetical protein